MSIPPAGYKQGKDNVNDLNNFKGIYFGGDNEQTYFEAGAHFRYKDLCGKLEKIVLSLTPDRRGKTMYDDHTYINVKGNIILKLENNSFRTTKVETRKIASECSKVSTMINHDTRSASNTNHISPNPVTRARNVIESINKNKKHHVSQEKPLSSGKNTFQSKLTINTLKNNRINNHNLTKQYIKKINPNYIISASSKSKEKCTLVDLNKNMKARILEITEKNTYSQKPNNNISSLKRINGNNNNIYPISSKNTSHSLASRNSLINNGNVSKKSDYSGITIEKSLKHSVDSNTPSDIKALSECKRKNELLNSMAFKSRNVGKFDLFKSVNNKDKNSFKNYSIDNNIRNSSSFFNNTKGYSVTSKTVNKIVKPKTSLYPLAASKMKNISLPYKNNCLTKDNKLLTPFTNQIMKLSQGTYLKNSYKKKMNDKMENQNKEKIRSVSANMKEHTISNFKKIIK